ncbi:MAG: 16S rRNA (uracil(1498)-N(3))-methyltransferase [Leptospiraceae bacterium]|nr:16S rRNA (uracil(1498)-N(3))-methyltransferase [Leptospiraceae bacterium]
MIFYRPTLEPDSVVKLSRSEVQHCRALRLENGAELLVSDGWNQYAHIQLEIPAWQFRIEKLLPIPSASEPAIRIVSALPAGQRLDWLLQKATELGMADFQPIHWQRSDRQNYNMARMRRILESAGSQSGRLRLPGLQTLVKASDWLADARNPSNDSGLHRVWLHPRAEISFGAWHQTVSAELDHNALLEIWIGPEGGFSSAECRLFAERRIPSAHLGNYILRVETAVLAALAVCAAGCSGM